MTFTTAEDAINLGRGELAAKSVGNYRDLYRTYRSDPLLQQVHARWPIIATWDDHEYSDDCWGSTATYFNGRKNEKDDERRRNAEQAFFEYLPIDEGAPGATRRPTSSTPSAPSCTRTRSSGGASCSASTSSWW